ncbi:DNA mismatch repair endonuclease MutL [Candidatus Parcubacteria bacterium]|nr:DNA mismatch repair endonuclease MutL [Candidatus Parcubacteria bacterium]
MKTIHILPPELVAKIAAGEVVERPASVIKELIENALDAGAMHIDVEVEEAGTKKIIVRDDGKGMSKEDLEICYRPHSTSKILNAEDLVTIRSFGFRGEALSSIAAVSHLAIKSRQSNSEFGHIIELGSATPKGTVRWPAEPTRDLSLRNEARGSEGPQAHPIGMQVGTEITVEFFFHSTPARKKFLKDVKTELRLITEVMTQFAIAFPAVGFTLTHNDKQILNLSAGQNLHGRIRSVLGEHLSSYLIPIEHESRYGEISGFITKPQAAHESKQYQYLFVNNRAVTDNHVGRTLKESYGSLLEPRAQPPFVLFLTLPYESVDVNIHPRKEEVAFAYPKEIFALVKEGSLETLSKHNLMYTHSSRPKDMDYHTADFLKSIVTPWNVKNIALGEILQIHNIYLLAGTDDGLLLIDQHAAHERILFEQFKEAYEKTRYLQKSLELTEPKMFELSASDAQVLQEHLETLRKIGFDLEHFGKYSFKLAAVPEIFKTRDHIKLITEVLHDLKLGKGVKHLDRETEKTLSYLACRSAIKAGDALEPEEQKKLVDKLLLSPSSYTCPHGRPTHIEISLKELDKMFKRR